MENQIDDIIENNNDDENTPKFINVTFNGDDVKYVARLEELTGLPGRYLIDNETYTIAFMRDNFTFIDELVGSA